ncbi:Uncharacterised protein [Citrobacter freundii]|nr:Uncharacterised protein [Citrobacter freundii]
MDIGFKSRVALPYRAQHQKKIEDSPAFGSDHFPGHQKRHTGRIRQDHIGRNAPHQLIKCYRFDLTFDLPLLGLVRRHFHFRQGIKCPQHQPGEIMLADQLMDPLRQILNTHIAIEIGIFSI